MNVLRDGRSERGTARVGKRHDLKTVRWYVLTLPTAGGGRDKISPSKGLDVEDQSLKRVGCRAFPSRASRGDVVRVFRPLLCGGEEGGRKDGKHEAAPAVQLRVYPVLRGGDLPDEAHASPIQFPTPGLFRRHDPFPLPVG